MRQRSGIPATLIVVATVLLALAAVILVLWAALAQPYGEHSITYVVSPTLALSYAAVALVGVGIAQRRRQR